MKRVPELDALRGLAALAVVGYHIAPYYAHMGWLSVDCFFVLSGYLITGILLANRDAKGYFRNFYARRSLRICPIYYLVLLWVVVSYQFFPTKYPIDGGMIVQYATYTQGLERLWGGPGRVISAFSHTWTLAIEEQFYLVWPLTIWLMPKRSFIPLCVALAAMSIGLRLGGLDGSSLPGRCDGFALGAILAILMSDESLAVGRRGVLRGVLLTAMASGGIGAAITIYAPSLLPTMLQVSGGTNSALLVGFANILFMGLIGWLIQEAGRPWSAPLRCRPLVYLGTISYGLYLYHFPVIFAVEAVARRFGSGMRFDSNRSLSRSALYFAISLAVAALSWRFIEWPILRFKDCFSYRRETTALPETQDRVDSRKVLRRDHLILP